MSPDEVEPQTTTLCTAELDWRAREVAEGKVDLVEADKVHAEAAVGLRTLLRESKKK